MKKFVIILGITLISYGLSAQTKLPSHSISFLGGINLNGGYEVVLESEYYFNSNHNTSLYGLVNFHKASESVDDYFYTARKAMTEIGWKKYFMVIKETFYPYIGIGMTAGMQNCFQNTSKADTDISKYTDTFLLGGVATLGLEYMFAPSISIVANCRFKYDGDIHYVVGGGLKFSF